VIAANSNFAIDPVAAGITDPGYSNRSPIAPIAPYQIGSICAPNKL
jgi:hypothetical protein